jgi:hypothetical protein
MIFHRIDIPYLFIHLSDDGYLSCFHFLGIVNISDVPLHTHLNGKNEATDNIKYWTDLFKEMLLMGV